MPGLDVYRAGQAGTALKNIAIGGAAVIAVIALVYYGSKIAAALSKGAQKAEEAGDFLFGADTAPETFGTWLYDQTHDESADDYFDEDQALRTCRRLAASRGAPQGELCRNLIAKFGM